MQHSFSPTRVGAKMAVNEGVLWWLCLRARLANLRKRLINHETSKIKFAVSRSAAVQSSVYIEYEQTQGREKRGIVRNTLANTSAGGAGREGDTALIPHAEIDTEGVAGARRHTCTEHPQTIAQRRCDHTTAAGMTSNINVD